MYDSSYKSAILGTVGQDLKGWAGKTVPLNRSVDLYESHRSAHSKARSSFQSQADAYAEEVLGKQRGTAVKVMKTSEGTLPEHYASFRDDAGIDPSGNAGDVQEGPDKSSEAVVPALNLSALALSALEAHNRFPVLGSRVKIHSLQMMPKFNGEIGTVQGTTDEQRVEVLLDAFPDTLTSIKPDNLVPVTSEAALPTALDSATSQVDGFDLDWNMCNNLSGKA